MPVNVSNEEMKIFNDNGISVDQVKHTVNLYRQDGLSDNEIRTKIDTKMSELQNQLQVDVDNQSQGNNSSRVLTGSVSKNYTQNWDNKGRIYYTDENGNIVNPKNNLGVLEKTKRKIQAAAFNANNWFNESNPNKDAYKQKANTILALATMPLGVGSAVTKWGAGKLTPFLGKKISQNVAEGIGAGVVGGGVEGIGRGFIESENPLKTGFQDATLGGLLGGVGAGAFSKGVQLYRGSKLKKTKISNDTIKNVRKDETKYYKDYIQGTSTKRNDLGNINYTQTGLETVSKQPSAGKYYPDLKSDIKTAEYIGEEMPKHPRNDDIIKFHRLKKGDKEFLIGETTSGKKYYMSEMTQDSGEVIEPSNFGVADIDSELNKKTAHQMEKTIIAEKELLQEYKIFHADIVKEYGSIENLKAQAIKEMKELEPYGAITPALNKYREIIEYEKLLQNARYVNTNIRNSTTREIINNSNPQLGLSNIKDNKKAIEHQPSRVEPMTSNNIITDNADNFNPNGKNIETKKSSLAQNADLPNELSKAIKQNPPEYEILHNDDLIATAQEEISKNPSSRLARLHNLATKKTPLAAQDFEEARQLVGKLYQEGRIDEALALTENISNAASKAGQAVQVMSLWGKTTPQGAIRQAQKIINDYNKTAAKKIPPLTKEQAEIINNLAENAQAIPEGREKDIATATLLKKFQELIPQSAGNKLKTYRNISLLLNGKTLSRNIVGNLIFSGMENFATKPLAAGLDKLASFFTKQQTRSLPHLKQYGQGLIQGFKEGMEDVKLGIDTRNLGGRFDLPQARSFRDTPVLGALERGLDYSLRVPDRAFYQATFNESLANQMKAKGLDKPTPDIIKNATLEALESVYQNNGVIASMASDSRKALNKLGFKDFGFGDVLMPYAQTPANVAQQGINYSPLGIINAIKSGINRDQRQATLDTARSIIGGGIISVGALGAKNGFFTDNIDDYQARKNYEALGIRPNQITFPNTDTNSKPNISYSQLQPLAAPLATGNILNNIQGDNYVKAMDKSLDTLADLGMLRGITNFIKDYKEDGLATAVANSVSSVPSQFVPTAFNHINTYIDPYQREAYSPNPIVQGINRAKEKIPFLSKTLPKKYDVAGQEIKKYDGDSGFPKALNNFLNPVFINKPKEDIVLKEVTTLYETTGSKGSLLNIPEKKIKLDNGKSKLLNGKEFSQYSKRLGEVTYHYYNQIMHSPIYLNADDDDRLKLLEKVKKNAKGIVQEELFGKINKQDNKNSISKILENKLNRGQNKIDRMQNKIYNQLVDDIMYKE